ncbi:SUKH-4 family immunity protein, partial [Nocardia salmonicida]|uniref:SUKH-4 family immunity protein n=1 Tax=Nocardia salmonicida TaxID=53431 RepID=UPI00340F4467
PGPWLSFGRDYETDFVVEATSGQVWSMSDSQSHPDRFVNSSLLLFVGVLTKVSAARAGFAGQDDPEIDERIARLEEEIRRVDPQALSLPENWWAVIFEQMRDGLL